MELTRSFVSFESKLHSYGAMEHDQGTTRISNTAYTDDTVTEQLTDGACSYIKFTMLKTGKVNADTTWIKQGLNVGEVLLSKECG